MEPETEIDPYPDGEDLDPYETAEGIDEAMRLHDGLNQTELHNMDAEAQRERQALIDFNQITKDAHDG